MEIFNKHPQWAHVKKICTKIREHGFTAWLAGGCVRDGLMGVMPHDFDVATNARPKKIESFFNRTVDVGKAFGVIRVIEDTSDIEVATFRKDGAYVDGRHPVSVELATPEEDAQRRDFTINALFYDPFEGEVHDFVNGMQDIKAKIIRTVGVAADRFLEDRLRILRAVRFVSQLDFNLDDTTYKAVCQFAPLVAELKYERVHDEVNKLFRGLRPDRGVDLLEDSGLLAVILPEITFVREDASAFFSQLCGHADREELGWLYVVNCAKSDDAKELIYKRFKFSNEKKERIRNALELITALRIFNRLTLADKKRAAADREVNLALSFLQLSGNRAAGAAAHADLEGDTNVAEAAVFLGKNGKLPARFVEAQDLIALGVEPGRRMGELIESCFEAQLEEQFLSKSEALVWVKLKLNKATN